MLHLEIVSIMENETKSLASKASQSKATFIC